MVVILSDAEAAAVLLFLSQCECQADAVGQVCQSILERCIKQGASKGVGGSGGAVVSPAKEEKKKEGVEEIVHCSHCADWVRSCVMGEMLD